MRPHWLAALVLVGAGGILGWLTSFEVQAQVRGGRSGGGGGGAARGGGGVSRPNPGVNRPAARPSTPTMSRPQVQPRPNVPAARPSTPAIGQRPNLPNAGAGTISRPAVPKPVVPTPKPNLPTTLPATRPGGGGVGAQVPGMGGVRPSPTPLPKPAPKPLPGGGANSNNRPGLKPEGPTTLPGVTHPQLPTTRPTQPPIGVRPNLPNRPDGTLPNRPVDRPNISPGVRPDIGNRGNINTGNQIINNRPTVNVRPGLRPDGGHNTVIGNNNNRVTNINNNFNTINTLPANRPWVNNVVGGYHTAWNNNFRYWHTNYHGWYHGYCHGYWHGGWGIGYTGWNPWAVAGLSWAWGYWAYRNPFYVAPVQPVTYVNYSQPIVLPAAAPAVEGQPEPPPPAPPPETATQAFDAARSAFRDGNYATAQTKIEQALQAFPNDPVAHEFRALVLFARGEYRSASAAVHAILAGGPGWDWTTMSGLYADVSTYKAQLAALEKAAAAAPADPATHFLLGYHYTTIDQADAAKAQLEIVHKLLPDDAITTRLLTAAGGAPADPPKPKPAETKPNDIQLDVIGSWSAPQPGGGAIGLTMTADGKFEWSFTQNGKAEKFGGTFTIDDNVMMLERSSGGALTGTVEALAANKFAFKVVGGGDADPGLVFVKK